MKKNWTEADDGEIDAGVTHTSAVTERWHVAMDLINTSILLWLEYGCGTVAAPLF